MITDLEKDQLTKITTALNLAAGASWAFTGSFAVRLAHEGTDTSAWRSTMKNADGKDMDKPVYFARPSHDLDVIVESEDPRTFGMVVSALQKLSTKGAKQRPGGASAQHTVVSDIPVFGKVDVLRAGAKFGKLAGERMLVLLGMLQVPVLSLKMMAEVKTAMWHDPTLDRDTRVKARNDVIWIGGLMKFQR
ncbi:Hypothetical protein A7982_07246 [Minicystis rosea]|nr:Hypothetical protein A7982_07246 [Minicystis rosea]